jgi:hypothetical protein
MNPQIDSDLVIAERKAKRFWVSLVVTFLGLQVIIGIASLRLATGDPSVAIVPDYHTTALNWDAQRRKNTAAERLGVHITVKASDVADGQGNRAIEVQIADDQAAAMSDFRLSAQLYHHVDANHVQTISFKNAGDGRYLSLAPMARPGTWQLELIVEGAEEPITQPVIIEVAS